MKRIWRHKWLLIVATAVIFLSVGAVAWATVGNDCDKSCADCPGTATDVVFATGNDDGALAESEGPGTAVRKAFLEKREQFRRLQARLMEELREDMTPADQALYDQLKATLKERMEALQEARESVKETLGELRELGKKYLEDATETTG